jgi:hypothetical protein
MAQLIWRKSSFSTGDGDNCVEVATGVAGVTHLRESDDPRTVITTTPLAFGALVRRIKAGQLDELGS